MQWYAIQVTTQHEKKLKRHLERKKLDGAAGIIGDIYIPEKDGKNLFPGYIFVQCEEWPQRFLLGSETKCKTLNTVSDVEMQKMIGKITGVVEVKPPKRFQDGDIVTITAGPFIGLAAVIIKAGSRKSKVSLNNGGLNIEYDNRALEISK